VPYADLADVRLYYERAGSGDPELLFVPGWCCDHTAFRPQFEHFAATHAVTALDLRGVGKSSAPEDGYAIPDFAADLAQFCGALGIERPVVVGHSSGALIGIELAAEHPGVPRALVLVDPGPIAPLPESVEEFEEFAAQLGGPDGETARREYTENMRARDENLARWIVDLMGAVPISIAAAAVRGIRDWDGRTSFARCTVPALLLRAELRPTTDALRLREIKPDLEVGFTVGAGHFHQLEVPEQVNAMIERFLALSV
jgi:pimeloyl-ACP methyl ester carboxylesterase